MKNRLENLAVMGGKPQFENQLMVGRPNIGNKERFLARVDDMLESRWLSNSGKYCNQFEEKLAEMLGANHCIAMCNGTIALEIVIRALGLKGEVIVPSMTFVATAHSLQWQEITPVFCDIDRETYNIDISKIESLITPKTTGIIGVHLWGRPCNVSALDDLAKRHGLALIYDAAHAFGCSAESRPIGNFGDAEVFSFHATKFINSFEGGAVTTNDDDLAHNLRLMRNFGFSGYDEVSLLGTNGKMTEVSAAMGLTSLESMQDFIDINYRNYKNYEDALSEIPGIQLMTFKESEKCNFQYIVFEMDSDRTGIERDVLLDVLHKENILARRYFWPGCHRMEPYQSHQPHAHLLLPKTEDLASRIIVLPTGTAVDDAAVADICSIIRTAIENGAKLQQSYDANDSC